MAAPHTEAMAYRIWSVAEPIGWDITEAELARRLHAPQADVRGALQSKKWHHRLRRTGKADPGPLVMVWLSNPRRLRAEQLKELIG